MKRTMLAFLLILIIIAAGAAAESRSDPAAMKLKIFGGALETDPEQPIDNIPQKL